MSAPDARPPVERAPPLAAYAMLAGLVMLLRPYRGVVHDSRIYIGRAMADLDPAGIGRDLMFLHDNQTGWSLLRPIARWLVGAVGPGLGAELLAVVGLALWSVAAVGLLTAVFGRKDRWAAAVAMLALPAAYGAFGSFTFAEPWATPRLFAEAGALAGVALVMRGRWAWGGAAFLIAALFHPLMTAPALGIVFIWLALWERRLGAAAVLGMAVLFAAAAVGAPLAERLLLPMDVEWRRSLELRSPYLFPQLWPVESWSRLVLQAVTLLVARSLVPSEPARRLLTAVLIGAALALAAAAVFSWSLVVLQLQLWRAVWVLAALANGAAGYLAVSLWRQGRLGSAALAALAAAWLLADGPAGALIALVAAAAWSRLRRRDDKPLSRRAVQAAWMAVGAVFLIWFGQRLLAVGGVAAGAPIGARREIWLYVLGADLGVLFAVLAVAWAALGLSERAPRWSRMAGAAGLCLAGVLVFDTRSDFRRRMEGLEMRASFEAAAPGLRGPIFWAQTDVTPWFVAGQGAWATAVQAAPGLFSRDLAMTVQQRLRRLIALDLERADALTPFSSPVRTGGPIVGQWSAVAALCALPNGPSAVVLQDRQPQAVPPQARPVYWRPPIPEVRFDVVERSWRRTEVFTVIPCAWPSSGSR